MPLTIKLPPPNIPILLPDSHADIYMVFGGGFAFAVACLEGLPIFCGKLLLGFPLSLISKINAVRRMEHFCS